MAIDGKKLRRSQERRIDRDGIWMVSAWSSENRLNLAVKKNQGVLYEDLVNLFEGSTMSIIKISFIISHKAT